MASRSDVDIVDRLRIIWTSMTDMGNHERAEAADEIERLREALRIEQEELAACCIDRRETQRERDEARRWITDLLFKGPVSKKKIAEAHGWTGLFPDEDKDMEGDVE